MIIFVFCTFYTRHCHALVSYGQPAILFWLMEAKPERNGRLATGESSCMMIYVYVAVFAYSGGNWLGSNSI